MKGKKSIVRQISVDEENKLLTATQAAREMRVTPHIIRKLCKQKEIQAFWILNQWRISRESIERYLIRNSNTA